jgi:kynurenine formamidase
MKSYVDLTRYIEDRMPVYPGDEQPLLRQVREYGKDPSSDFRLVTTMHTGTHIDGSMHLTSDKRYICDFQIEKFFACGVLLDVYGENEIKIKSGYESEIMNGSIVVIRTGYESKYGTDEYYKEHPVVTMELAGLFIEKKVKMVCMDMPSPDRSPFPVHRLLLDHGILIAENLMNLERLAGIRKFEIIALPLRIRADSSPARIVACITA